MKRCLMHYFFLLPIKQTSEKIVLAFDIYQRAREIFIVLISAVIICI